MPQRHQAHVVQALEERGFQFEDDTSSYVNAYHYSRKSSASSLADLPPPHTPPPTTLSDLQTRTFATLARCAITPTIDPHLRLVQCCASRKPPPRRRAASTASTASASSVSSSSAHAPPEDTALHLALIKSLITNPLPRFLSLTLTDADPASLLLDHALLPHFPPDVLLGAKDDFLVPIALDLRTLPLESTGIVCGVAGRLMGGTAAALGAEANRVVGRDPVEMGYLSTARAGTVMVAESELERAMGALRGGEVGA